MVYNVIKVKIVYNAQWGLKLSDPDEDSMATYMAYAIYQSSDIV